MITVVGVAADKDGSVADWNVWLKMNINRWQLQYIIIIQYLYRESAPRLHCMWYDPGNC